MDKTNPRIGKRVLSNTLVAAILLVSMLISCQQESGSSHDKVANDTVVKDVKGIVLNREGFIDGYDPHTGSIIDPINVWKDYEDRTFAGKVNHGEKVTLLRRVGDGVLIETSSGLTGWVTYFFIKDFKE